ncbi:MAG: hypothetical protein HY513_05150 [Candidatus Aenigmarchaeota archaeon]|nr:hypothetical protein [Candidatus Aenigmarchaeota archaeon]
MYGDANSPCNCSDEKAFDTLVGLLDILHNNHADTAVIELADKCKESLTDKQRSELFEHIVHYKDVDYHKSTRIIWDNDYF